MYLARLKVNNFRCLESVEFKFRPGLNVIVGENNTGKSALIDALRLVFDLGTSKREIFASEDDLHHDDKGVPTTNKFEIEATFKALSVEEQGQFSMCLSPSIGIDVAQVHIRYEVTKKKGRRRGQMVVWGGETEGESIAFEMFDGIRAVHLPALRDALVSLRPGRQSRISKLLQLMVADEQKCKDLENVVNAAQEKIEKDDLIVTVKGQINRRLKEITGELMAQSADLRFSPPEFRRITESIRALVGDRVPLELEENGLGYNNLLYIAAVLGELQQAKAVDEIDLAVLLIEEPEAHLHPHLQTILIDYLSGLTGSGLDTDEGKSEDINEGQSRGKNLSSRMVPVQIFVTSHSPVLAARAILDSLNVMYFGDKKHIKSYALAKCSLDSKERLHLQRFLDVTKAQLFFAKGIILVEGISEALLLPEMARLIGQPYPLEKMGISVVNIQSLGFKNFTRLFQEGGLQIPTAVISDADPGTNVFPTEFKVEQLSETAEALIKEANGYVKVFLAVKNLEYDLALAGNAPYMGEVYEELRPIKGKTAREAMSKTTRYHEQAKLFVDNFDSKDKAKFAQHLSLSLAKSNQDFSVPGHLKDAIEYVTGRIRGRAED